MKILLFHHLRTTLGVSEIVVAVEKTLSQNELWDLLIHEYPKLEPFRKNTRIACNQIYATDQTEIHPQDEVALIPPVSGG